MRSRENGEGAAQGVGQGQAKNTGGGHCVSCESVSVRAGIML
jgi:hypothetical protein